MTAQLEVKLNCCGNTPFDRSNPESPPYLYQLRNVGHWRRWKYAGTYRELSTALRNLEKGDFLIDKGQWLPEHRGCVLDAGCGHSSDAYFAMRRWGFKEGVKIDLFPPYATIPEFLAEMERIEKNRTRFIQGDICKLSDYVPPESVDLIACSAVLDLMDAADRNLFYSEAYDAMRPGGVMTIYYQWLVHGHHDWGDGFQDRRNANELGFDCLDFTPCNLILRKPELAE